VCKVRDPACGACPLRAWCGAYQNVHPLDNVSHIPRRRFPGLMQIFLCCPPDQRLSCSRGVAAGSELPDIEELCTMCEPLPVGSAVTAYPMKAEKKKAREELDVVSVVEWRHPTTHERWFLLVRRPEGGQQTPLSDSRVIPSLTTTLSSGHRVNRSAGRPARIPHRAKCRERADSICPARDRTQGSRGPALHAATAVHPNRQRGPKSHRGCPAFGPAHCRHQARGRRPACLLAHPENLQSSVGAPRRR
jgi:hypothetical protein